MALEMQSPAWVFVSHASADLPKVRQVRNFIEDRGGGPILFYLRSLTEPEEFWPLIEREIRARNFFLLCDSPAAQASSWVQRERAAVAAISEQRPIRVGRVAVDAEAIDFQSVERFMTTLRVRLLHPAAVDSGPVFRTLSAFGYGFIGAIGLSATGVSRIGDGSSMSDDLIFSLTTSARDGWLMVILNREMAASPHVLGAIPRHGRLVIAAADQGVDMTPYRHLAGALFVEPRGSLEETVSAAANAMLTAEAD